MNQLISKQSKQKAYMKFLVTGGAGFIGSNLVDALVSRGASVRVLDNFATGKVENLQMAINNLKSSIEIINGDIRDYKTVLKAAHGIDVILHQAALPSVPRSIKDPITTNEVNVNGTINVLKAAVDSGAERVIYASSSSVYGDNPTLPKVEEMIPNPLSPYAVSKLAGEKYCQVFSRVYGLHTISLRYFNVFGPRQDPSSQYAAVIPKFIISILDEKRPIIYGDGEQSRDFTYVKNIVEANLLAADADCLPGCIMNCACHGQTTLNQLVNQINAILKKNVQPIYSNSRSGDIKHSYASIQKAAELIGYKPIEGFNNGLEKTIRWYETLLP